MYHEIAASSAIFPALFLLRGYFRIQPSHAVDIALALDDGQHNEDQCQTDAEQDTDDLWRVQAHHTRQERATHDGGGGGGVGGGDGGGGHTSLW